MKQYEEVLLAITSRTKSFLSEDMGIELMDKETTIDNEDKFQLYEYTAIIGLGGDIKALTIFSFDTSLANKLVDSFIYGEVTQEERDSLINEIAAEVANTVLGNAIPSFPNDGKGATITPPIIIEDAKLAMKLKDSCVLTTKILTKHGNAQCALLN